jgi:hypothetical protein
LGEYAQWDSDKTAKTRFRRFRHYLTGVLSGFIGGAILWFAGGGGLYRVAIFSGRGHRCCYRAERGRCPAKSLNDSSQGGGDVWYPLESGHQGSGIGVLVMSVYTTKPPKFVPDFGRKFIAYQPKEVVK